MCSEGGTLPLVLATVGEWRYRQTRSYPFTTIGIVLTTRLWIVYYKPRGREGYVS
jgi:hypothetical protein